MARTSQMKIEKSLLFNFRLFFVIASIFHLLLIGADRLFAISSPFKHKVLVTRRKLYCTIFSVWILSFVGFALFESYDLKTSKEPMKKSLDNPKVGDMNHNHSLESNSSVLPTSNFTFTPTSLPSISQPQNLSMKQEAYGHPLKCRTTPQFKDRPPPPPKHIEDLMNSKENI